jgi:hypothetical protein
VVFDQDSIVQHFKILDVISNLVVECHFYMVNADGGGEAADGVTGYLDFVRTGFFS